MRRLLILILVAVLVVSTLGILTARQDNSASVAQAASLRLKQYDLCALTGSGVFWQVLADGRYFIKASPNTPIPATFDIVKHGQNPMPPNGNGCLFVWLQSSEFPEANPDAIPVVSWEFDAQAPLSTAWVATVNGVYAQTQPSQQRCRDLTMKDYQWRYNHGPALTPTELAALGQCWNLNRPVPPPTRFYPYIPPVLPMPVPTPRGSDPGKGK